MLGAGISLEIEPISVLVHAGLFFAVLWVFSRFVVNPMSKVHEARHAATGGLQDKVVELTEQVNAVEQTYSEKIAQARSEAMQARESLRQQGVEKSQAITDAARKQTIEKLEQALQLPTQLHKRMRVRCSLELLHTGESRR